MAVKGGHGPDQVERIPDTSRFIGGMHGQLGSADVHSGNGDLAGGKIPQGGSPRQIRTVEKYLTGDALIIQDGAKQRVRYTVSGIALVSGKLNQTPPPRRGCSPDRRLPHDWGGWRGRYRRRP